jgi:hypothetical protein
MLIEAARVGVLPEAFWRLSLKEWRMLIEPAGGDALGRAAFEVLAQRWSDD